jgi:glutamate-1-semialdehyde 2,1-aminomutase
MLTAWARGHGIPFQAANAGTMWGSFFTNTPVVDYETAKTADTARYGRFFHAMLAEGVYLAPSQFEAAFTSAAHDDLVLGQVTAALGRISV